MKFPRVIRLDASDQQIFRRAAEPGELAVPGGFAFIDSDPAILDRKDRLAFVSGWLGIESFGHATLVEVAEIEESAFFQAVERLAQHFVERYGAPSLVEALPAAREEADYAADLCEHKLHTLLAVEREMSAEGLKERFKIVQPSRARDHAKIWEIASGDEGEES